MLVFTLLGVNKITAQNYILNGGFENYSTSSLRPNETLLHLLTDYTTSPTIYYMTGWMKDCNQGSPSLMLKEGAGSPYNTNWQTAIGSFNHDVYKFPNGDYTSNNFYYDCNNINNENSFLALSNDPSLEKWGAGVNGTFQTALDLFKYYTIRIDVALPTSAPVGSVPNCPFNLHFKLLNHEPSSGQIECEHNGDMVFQKVTLSPVTNATANCGWVTYEARFSVLDLMRGMYASNGVVEVNPAMGRSYNNDSHLYDHDFWAAQNNGTTGPYITNPYFNGASGFSIFDLYDFKKHFAIEAEFLCNTQPLSGYTGMIFIDNVRLEEELCTGEIEVENSILDGSAHFYEAQKITANNEIKNASSVNYKAEESILLKQDFFIEAESNGLFYIRH